MKECVPEAAPSACVDGSDDEIPRRRRQPRRSAAAAAANVEHIGSVGELTPTSSKRKRRSVGSVASPKSYNEDDDEEYEEEFVSLPKSQKRHYCGRREPRALRGSRNWSGPTKLDSSGVRRPVCTIPGCNTFAQGIGKQLCSKHGAVVHERKRCKVPGCKSRRQKFGLCYQHGAPIQKCKVKGCKSGRMNNGVCRKHGATVKLCRVDGCPNQVIQGGVCQRHGANVARWVCKEPGCDKNAQTGGKCYKHSQIKPERKKCVVPGCNKIGIKPGCYCCRHAEREDCTFPGCSNIVIRFRVCGMHGAFARSMCALPRCRKMAVKGELCPACGGPTVPEGEVDQSKTRVRRRICNHPDGCTNLAKKNGLCEHHIGDRETCQVDGCTNWVFNFKLGVCRRHRAKCEEGGTRRAVPDKVKSAQRRSTRTRNSLFDDSESEEIKSTSDEEVELKSPTRRSGRKRNHTSMKEPESESEEEDDGSTDKPTREILAWDRSMSEEDKRKHVTTGLRVKVRFSNNIWYGGIIKNAIKRGRRGTTVAIDFDDGTAGVMDFPHHDIIVDDTNNGEHKADAMAFVPHKTSEDDYDQSEEGNEGEDLQPENLASIDANNQDELICQSNLAEASDDDSDSQDDEELGALIYRSSETGKSLLAQVKSECKEHNGSPFESSAV